MKTREEVYLEIKDSIGTIIFNRPEKRNAIHSGMWERLLQIVDECEANDDVKVMIFRGADETAFSAGADISEFHEVRDTGEKAYEYHERMVHLEEKIKRATKPSIAMIQGFCVGGGCGLAIACDFRFADPTAKLGITPAKLGIVYPTISTKNLVELVGPSNAKDLLYTGRLLTADEALKMGLINRIIRSDQIEKETYDYAKILVNNSSVTIKGAKMIINEVLDGAVDDSEAAKKMIKESVLSPDYMRRIDQFLNRKK